MSSQAAASFDKTQAEHAAAMSYMPMDVESAKMQKEISNPAGHASSSPLFSNTIRPVNVVGESPGNSVFFAPFFNNKTTGTDNDNASQTCSQASSSVQSLSSNISFTVGKENKAEVVTAIYISIFAMLGALTRMVTAQFFGEECASPGTVGWLAASAPLCVTADGYVTSSSGTGGVIFADLPANLFGSFIMGLFQNGSVLDLAVPMAIAWLPPNHSFQKMKIIHKAIMTGYCGSVTTFSGWNSAMVVQIFGYVLTIRIVLYVSSSRCNIIVSKHTPISPRSRSFFL